MKKSIIYALASSALVLATGCTDLDVDVKSKYTEYPNESEIALEAKMSDVYYAFRTQLGNNYNRTQTFASDEASGISFDGDYYDSADIGKPTGNDMAEGKLTLPVIYAVNSANDPEMTALAFKVKDHTASQDEIARLVAFAKEHGGIEYAEQRMEQLHAEAVALLDSISSAKTLDGGAEGSCKGAADGSCGASSDACGGSAVKEALMAYLDFVIKREK